MEDLSGYVKRRTLAGIRWTLIFNVATFPLSFLTNMLLGRTSAEALGYYGAIQIFVGTFNVFLVPGGSHAFNRLVPSIKRHLRLAFLKSYLLLVLGVLGIVSVFLLSLGRPLLDWILERFGIPGWGIALGLCIGVILLGFTSYFLYSVLDAPQATLVQKTVVIGFCLFALLGWGPLRNMLSTNPSGYLWPVAVGVYGASACLGLLLVFRTGEARTGDIRTWFLPRGFGSVVFYAHLGTIITFAYTSLTPTFVLLWLDVESLARLHAALRYVVLLTTLPMMAASVIAPSVAKLDASGMREKGLAHLSSAIRASFLLITPACIGLVFFAGDAMSVFNPEFHADRDILRIASLMMLATPIVYLGSGVAIALGAFREYTVASLVFVVSAVALTCVLVPTLGLTGAALAIPAGALIQETALSFLLRRRFGFRVPNRARISWACGVAAVIIAFYLDPGRLVAAAAVILFLILFALASRITPSEITGLTLRLLGKE